MKNCALVGFAIAAVLLLMWNCPVQARVTAGAEGNTNAEEITGEELVKMSPNTDIMSFVLKEKVSAANAARGKKVDFGTTVENIIVGDCWIAWYNNAKVNGAAGVIILLSSIPDSSQNYAYTNYANIVLERTDNNDREKLDSFAKNPETKTSYLLDCIKKIKTAQTGA